MPTEGVEPGWSGLGGGYGSEGDSRELPLSHQGFANSVKPVVDGEAIRGRIEVASESLQKLLGLFPTRVEHGQRIIQFITHRPNGLVGPFLCERGNGVFSRAEVQIEILVEVSSKKLLQSWEVFLSHGSRCNGSAKRGTFCSQKGGILD